MTDTQQAVEALRTLTDLPWTYGQTGMPDDHGAPQVHFVSEVSKAQNKRLEYLYKAASTLVKIAIPRSGNHVAGVLDGYNLDALVRLAENEPQRRTEGPEAAKVLTALTETPWRWDGLRVVSEQGVFTDPNYALSDKLNDLQSSGAFTWHMSTEQSSPKDPEPGVYADLSHFNLQRMKDLQQANTFTSGEKTNWGAMPKGDFGHGNR